MKTTSCTAISSDSGEVHIIRHVSDNLEIPLVNQLKATYCNEKACVLTNKNDEAAHLVGLLIKHGIRARLIQSVDGFRFSNLAEVRFFLKQIDKCIKSPVISDLLWESAKQKTLAQYADSDCLDYIKVFFHTFENSNRYKYRSDLEEFVFESNLEDFCPKDNQTVFVSTIHKSKGREFDTVYMLLDDELADTDENRCKLYVGMTRAKQRLFIHCNTGIFDALANNRFDFKSDTTHYPAPEEITLPLTLRDVFLDYFKSRKKQILMLRSGMQLSYNNGFLSSLSGESVAYLSKQKRANLQEWAEKDYYVASAKISFIVAWKGKDDTEETAVLLPELTLRKINHSQP